MNIVTVDVVQMPAGPARWSRRSTVARSHVTQTATPYLIQAVQRLAAVAIAGDDRQPDLQPDRQAVDRSFADLKGNSSACRCRSTPNRFEARLSR